MPSMAEWAMDGKGYSPRSIGNRLTIRSIPSFSITLLKVDEQSQLIDSHVIQAKRCAGFVLSTKPAQYFSAGSASSAYSARNF